MSKTMRKWLIFGVVAIFSFLAMVFLQQRYTTMLQGGDEYQWPVTLERSISWIPSDYLTVHFAGTRTTWTGSIEPLEGQLIYVSIGAQPNGILYIKNASNHKPDDSAYMMANVTRFSDGIVDFTVPFDRVRLDLKEVDPAFYNNYKGVLLATLKISNGEGIVTGVYSNGVSIQLAKPDPAKVSNDEIGVPLPGGKGGAKVSTTNDGVQKKSTSGDTTSEP